MFLELKPYKPIFLTKDIDLAIDIEILMLENLPGPWLINIFSISSKFVLFFFKKSKRS